jgi:hypothetical protein
VSGSKMIPSCTNSSSSRSTSSSFRLNLSWTEIFSGRWDISTKQNVEWDQNRPVGCWLQTLLSSLSRRSSRLQESRLGSEASDWLLSALLGVPRGSSWSKEYGGRFLVLYTSMGIGLGRVFMSFILNGYRHIGMINYSMVEV